MEVEHKAERGFFGVGTQDTAKVWMYFFFVVVVEWILFSKAEKREFLTSQSQVQPDIKSDGLGKPHRTKECMGSSPRRCDSLCPIVSAHLTFASLFSCKIEEKSYLRDAVGNADDCWETINVFVSFDRTS